ncbi:hypothetical protein [Rhizobium sp. ZW T2_16]|uniref:hypothetical protein n=1 Tax=Rhizobium sp. ZW T2_16 TaxID=3378083 RepID=UPI003855351D
MTETVFQQPYQIEATRCDVVNTGLIKAVIKAKRKSPELWSAIGAALDMFLLGHSEAPELDDQTCIMLSAMAFERLLGSSQTSGIAVQLSKALVELFLEFPCRRMSQSLWLKCDAKWQSEQGRWPIRQKWMKELYEARSAQAHRGTRDQFSSNFEPEKHMVISAFVFPLAIKLKLAHADLYRLSCDDVASCEVLDELIDSNWGGGFEDPPEWPTILDTAQAMRGRRDAIVKAIRKVGL